ADRAARAAVVRVGRGVDALGAADGARGGAGDARAVGAFLGGGASVAAGAAVRAVGLEVDARRAARARRLRRAVELTDGVLADLRRAAGVEAARRLAVAAVVLVAQEVGALAVGAAHLVLAARGRAAPSADARLGVAARLAARAAVRAIGAGVDAHAA